MCKSVFGSIKFFSYLKILSCTVLQKTNEPKFKYKSIFIVIFSIIFFFLKIESPLAKKESMNRSNSLKKLSEVAGYVGQGIGKFRDQVENEMNEAVKKRKFGNKRIRNNISYN